MKKLKCSSCGAELQVEDNKEYAVCNHCGTKYKLNEDLNVNIKLDDNMKEVLNNGLGTVKHFSKFMLIPIILAIIIFAFILITIISSFSITGKMIKTNDDTYEKAKEEMKKEQKEIEGFVKQIFDDTKEETKDIFNLEFEFDNGTKNGFFVQKTLDKIINSNKKHDRKVSLVFNGTETTDESEIIDIKHSLSGDYEVSFNYDNDGYINKIIVEKIN